MKGQTPDLPRWLVAGRGWRWRGGCSNSVLSAAPLASWHWSMPRAPAACLLKGSTTASNSRKINWLIKPLSDELATLRNDGTGVGGRWSTRYGAWLSLAWKRENINVQNISIWWASYWRSMSMHMQQKYFIGSNFSSSWRQHLSSLLAVI